MERIKRHLSKKTVREYAFSSIGAVLTAIGLVSFLIPNNIACGGVSGIAIVLTNVIGVPVGILMYLLNGLLFIVSFLVIGKEFGLRSIVCTFLLNFFVDFFDRVIAFPKYQGEDLFLAVFLGVSISAIGMALTFSQNSSTGGTDIIARILNKYFGTSIGLSLLLIDLVIGLAAGIAYNSRIGMYSILSVILNGITIDYVIKVLDNTLTVIIVSEKSLAISDYILHKLERGITVLKAEGGWSQKEKPVLYVALKRKEMTDTIHHLREIDPNAFIIVQEATHVIGEGFTHISRIF
jgi:uncharacterized membrane-anchored protein YitT (DUF2179 family)